MPAMEVVFHRLAAREYRAARDWYAARSREAAERFLSSVDKAIEHIAAGYEGLPIVSHHYRRVRVNRFPYILIYRSLSEDSVMIVAVAHTSRRADYWRRRS